MLTLASSSKDVTVCIRFGCKSAFSLGAGSRDRKTGRDPASLDAARVDSGVVSASTPAIHIIKSPFIRNGTLRSGLLKKTYVVVSH